MRGMNSSGWTTPDDRRHRASASAPTHRPSARETVGRYSRKNSPWTKPSCIASAVIMCFTVDNANEIRPIVVQAALRPRRGRLAEIRPGWIIHDDDARVGQRLD